MHHPSSVAEEQCGKEEDIGSAYAKKVGGIDHEKYKQS